MRGNQAPDRRRRRPGEAHLPPTKVRRAFVIAGGPGGGTGVAAAAQARSTDEEVFRRRRERPHSRTPLLGRENFTARIDRGGKSTNRNRSRRRNPCNHSPRTPSREIRHAIHQSRRAKPRPTWERAPRCQVRSWR